MRTRCSLSAFPLLMINVFSALLWGKHPKPSLVCAQMDIAPSVVIERVQDEIRCQMGSLKLSLNISLCLFTSLVLSFEHDEQKYLLL